MEMQIQHVTQVNGKTQAIVETPQAPIAQPTLITQSPQAIASQAPQVRVTKNPRKVAAGRKGALARKAKLIHNSNTEHSPIKTWAAYAISIIAVVWLFYKTGEETTLIATAQDAVQL